MVLLRRNVYLHFNLANIYFIMRNSTIKPFKETQCIDCLSEGNDKIKKTISKRCFEYPFHYQKYKEGVYKERAENKASGEPKKNTAINKVSDKEKKRQALYIVAKKEYMKYKPWCEAKLEGCSIVAIDIHHLFMGSDRSKYFLDSTTWRSVCRHCHRVIHDELSSEQLIELGLRLKE